MKGVSERDNEKIGTWRVRRSRLNERKGNKYMRDVAVKLHSTFIFLLPSIGLRHLAKPFKNHYSFSLFNFKVIEYS